MRARAVSVGFVGLCAVLVAGLVATPVPAGTDANGFFDEYLTAIAYKSAGCDPGAARASDYLCDGNVSESDIIPADGFVLGPPVTVAGACTGDDPPALVDLVDGFDELALLDVDLNLPISAQVPTGTGGDSLDFEAITGNVAGNDAAMAYAWVWVDNVTGSPLTLQLGVGSDDSIHVELNRVTVLDVGACRGPGGAGVIQDTAAVVLAPGVNLVQFKVFQGSGGWGMRARFERPETCEIVLSGDGLIDVGVTPPADYTNSDFPQPAPVRAIAANGAAPGQVTANISVTTNNTADAYSLEEIFDEGWTLSNVNPAGAATGPSFVRWENVTQSALSYTLTRSGDWGASVGGVAGTVKILGSGLAVSGPNQIPGGLQEGVPAVLLTAAMDIFEGLGVDVETHGCNILEAEIEGDWIIGEDGAGNPVSDKTVVPDVGLVLRPNWGPGGAGASQSYGLDQDVIALAGESFWETIADPLGGMVLQEATSGNGTFDLQRGDIYGVDVQDCMSIAFFYVTNPDATARNVIIAFGSDDAGAVRVNGCLAHSISVCRGNPYPANADRFRATLRPGKNLISLYAFENGGGYSLSARFEDDDFNPLPLNGGPGTLQTTTDPAGYVPPNEGDACPEKGTRFYFYVPEVMVSAAFEMQNYQGCNVTPAALEGDWITDAAGTVSDANIVPEVGLTITPDYGGNAPNVSGLDLDVAGVVEGEAFWDAPGSLLLNVTSGNGLYDWQRADIYNSDPDQTMNVAYVYAVVEETRCVEIAFGSDDSGAVRVNGRVVHTVAACRGVPGFATADRFLAQLDAGKNLVALYTFDNGAGFGMRVRFEDPDTNLPIGIQTTLDPTGYDPAAHPEPDPACVTPFGNLAYMRSGPALGPVTQYLVNRLPFDQGQTSNTISGAVPEDYISVASGVEPLVAEDAFEGAIVEPGSTGLISTGVRGAETCGFTTLVKWDGYLDGDAVDPSHFDGEIFYGGQDQYNGNLLFHVNNKTNGDLDAWFGFASDDAASLFVNGTLVAEHLAGRGAGGNNVLQTFADAPTTLEPGDNLVQLSYNEGGGGSGARVGFFKSGCRDEAFGFDEVEISANPPGFTAPVVSVSRTIEPVDCDGRGSVTLTVSVVGGGSAQVDLSEELPPGVTGSNPSRGSFDGGGTVLTFSGQLADDAVITYDIQGTSAENYCFGTANGIPISGETLIRESTDVCDFDQAIYINCGGIEVTDQSGRTWLEDTLANPSKHLTSDNAHTGGPFAACDPATLIDLQTDPWIAGNLAPADPVIRDLVNVERWNNGPVEYTFTNLPAGQYQVALIFMEVCCSNGCASDGTPACDAVRNPQDGLPPLVDPEDPVVSAGGCRVFDILVNGTLVADQFSQNLLASCLAGTVPGAPSNCIAVSQVFDATVAADGRLVILMEDLGGGNPPENSSIKGISIESSGPCEPVPEICDNGRDDDCDGLIDAADTEDCGGGGFKRADVNADNAVNITDAIFLLASLFLGGPPPPCADASDCNDDNAVNITDAIYLLASLFLGGPPPPAPGTSACGPDPTADGLDCQSFPPCP